MESSPRTVPDAHSPAPFRTALPRPRAVCPECQHSQRVRVSGRLAKHRSFWTDVCPGAGLTPIPVLVPEPDVTPVGLHDGERLDHWDFLSLPLLTLLHTTRADVREVAESDSLGSVRPTSGGPWRWIVRMPIGTDVMEHDLVVRGLLAAAHGVDVSDWPVEMVLRSA